MRKIVGCALVVLVISLFASCKPTVPGDVIQPGKMEDILYDYHLAQAIVDQGTMSGNTQSDYNRHLYFDAVLKKYDVTEAQFDSSMYYYQRHTERLYNIYDNINKRLQDEAGTTANEVNNGKYANLGANSDTALIWKGNNAAFLLASAPFNTMSFCMKADSSYHAGDAFEFSMDVQFIMEDGSRDAVAMLAVRYDNDSVATQNIHMSSPSHYTLSIPSFAKHKIKEIRGFIFLAKGGDSKTTLKMLCVSNITLARFRQNSKAPVPSGASAQGMGPQGPHGPAASAGPNGPQQMQPMPMNQGGPQPVPQGPQSSQQNGQGTIPQNSGKPGISR